MSEKRRRPGKLANAIAEAALGIEVEKGLDDSYDDDTNAKVVVNSEDDDYRDIGDDEEDWKLDFETAPTATNKSQRSTLRTQTAPELDSLAVDDRYKGKKVSRKSEQQSRHGEDNTFDSIDEKEQAAAELGNLLEGDSDEEEGEEEEESSEEENEASFAIGNKNEIDYGAFGGMSEDDANTDDESDGLPVNTSENGIKSESDSDEDKTTIENVGHKDSNEYIKGLAIKSQMMVWDRLLEYRIQVQKILQCMNRLPQGDAWAVFEKELGIDINEDTNIEEKRFGSGNIKTCQSAITNLVESLLMTRSKLLQSNPESKKLLTTDQETNHEVEPPRKRRKISEYER